jgi:hypothetical protein
MPNPTMMKKHLSRRELTRRMEQGKEAMRVLAAVVVDAGGTIRVKRDSYQHLPTGHRLTVDRDTLTGDLILRAGAPEGVQIQKTAELTFAEIQARYGKKPEAEAAQPSEGEAGSPDGGNEPSPTS